MHKGNVSGNGRCFFWSGFFGLENEVDLAADKSRRLAVSDFSLSQRLRTGLRECLHSPDRLLPLQGQERERDPTGMEQKTDGQRDLTW